MSRFTIDNFDFDGQEGVIRTLQRESRVYTSPASPHIGLQVLAPRGPQFTLQLVRYCPAIEIEITQRFLVAHIGRLVTIVDHARQYIFPPWQLRFAVADVQIIDAQVVPFALTTRGSSEISLSPAGVVTSQWTMHAVPAYL